MSNSRAAIAALGMTNGKKYHELVITAFEKGDVYDRRYAIITPGLIGKSEDAALIESHLKSDDERTCKHSPKPSLLPYILLAPHKLSLDNASILVNSFTELGTKDGHLQFGLSLVELAKKIPEKPGKEWHTVCDGVIEWNQHETDTVCAGLLRSSNPATLYWANLL